MESGFWPDRQETEAIEVDEGYKTKAAIRKLSISGCRETMHNWSNWWIEATMRACWLLLMGVGGWMFLSCSRGRSPRRIQAGCPGHHLHGTY